ncbi:MAG: hypothetical protein K2M03_00075 [Muribaculaceae bacterium]|nr:hypothetical protein [Muribaculaceae bacterium]
MNVSLGQLADMVAVRLGEYPRRRLSGGGQEASLEDVCGELAGELSVRLTQSAELTELDCIRDMRDVLKRSADYGDEICVECELPRDFLRLRYLRMNGWARGVDSVTGGRDCADDETAAGLMVSLGECAPEWMRRQRGRGAAELLPPADGTGAWRIRLTPLIETGFREGVYIPRPYLENGYLCDISSCIIPELVERLAEAVGHTIE